MILSAILLAVSCDLHTLRMIEPPPQAPYVVDSSAIPYPRDGVGPVRLTGDHLGSMYGTLNGLLQRNFFTSWNESLPTNHAALSASDLPTADLDFGRFWNRDQNYWAYFAASRLGDYTNPTNRDFSADGIRVWRGAEILKDFFARFIGDWATVNPCYWLAVLPGAANMDRPKSQSDAESVAGFVVDDLAAQYSFSAPSSPLFLGDLAFRSLTGSWTKFSFDGYPELLDKDFGLLPKWAVKNLEYKGLPDFTAQFPDVAAGGRSPDGSSRGTSWGSAADAFLGDGALASLDLATRGQTVSPRVWWGQFALANFLLSLTRTAFLGMRQADWAQQMVKFSPYSRDKWYPCPSVRYSRQPFSGKYSDSKTALVGGIVYNGFTPGSGHHFTIDWSEVNAGVEAETASEEVSVDLGSPQNCPYVAAGWYDTDGSVDYTVQSSVSVNYPDGLYQDPYDAQPDDPFAADPAALGMQWSIEGRAFDPDTGKIELWIVPGDDSARFSDGDSAKLWRRMRYRGGEIPTSGTLYQSRRLAFAGSVPAGRHPFTGPTYREAGSQGDGQPDDKSLWPMTFHHELYSAGVVKTRINSFTTAGVSANSAAAQAVGGGAEFPEAQSYAAATGVDGVKILTRYKTERSNISSPGAWYSEWNSVYSITDITNDINSIAVQFREKYAQQTGEASSDEVWREYFLKLNLPTVDDAKDVKTRAKKFVFDNAWTRCTSNRYPTNVVDGAFMPGYTAITFDVGDGYTNVVANGSVGAFSFYFGSSEKLKDAERRHSIAVGYEKRALPFAYWNFPSMNGNN